MQLVSFICGLVAVLIDDEASLLAPALLYACSLLTVLAFLCDSAACAPRMDEYRRGTMAALMWGPGSASAGSEEQLLTGA